MGHAHAIQIVTNYEFANIVCPLLLELFFHLNLVRAVENQLTIIEDDDLFLGKFKFKFLLSSLVCVFLKNICLVQSKFLILFCFDAFATLEPRIEDLFFVATLVFPTSHLLLNFL